MVNFWEFFNRIKIAHQYYIAFLLSVPSFLSIIYHDYIKPSVLGDFFPTLGNFVTAFAVLYLPVLWLLSLYYYEAKENRPKYEGAKLDMLANPWNHSITKALIYLAEGEPEKAIKELEKWV